MRLGTSVVLGLSAAALVAAAQRRAEACSHPCIPRAAVLVAPEADATDVPRNAEIKLRWDSYFAGDPVSAFELVEVNGASVPILVRVDVASPSLTIALVLRPQALLAADTTYQVRLVDANGMGLSPSVGYFTTGATTLDTVAPEPPIDYSDLLVAGPTRACGRDDMPACCQPEPVHDLAFNPGVAGGPTLRTFTIREGTQVIAANLIGGEPGMVACATNLSFFDCGYHLERQYAWLLPAGTHTLAIEAVDLAGQVSTPVTRTLTLTCDALPATDAGVPDGDAGSPVASSGGDCGCRAAGRPARPGGASLLLLIAGAGVVVRARWRATAKESVSRAPHSLTTFFFSVRTHLGTSQLSAAPSGHCVPTWVHAVSGDPS